MKRIVAWSFFVVGSLLSGQALAHNCVGFVDLEGEDPFCPNVEWIKNRGITLGCAATSFCPDDYVQRITMAAFMNRLGNALEPRFAHAAQALVQASVNAGNRVCATTPVAIGGYPRVASPVGSMLYISSSASAIYGARLVYSVDGGTVWNDWTSVDSVGSASGNGFTSLSPTANALILDVGQTALFAILPVAFGGTVSAAGCELTVRMDSHTGAASPY
jgi:hypothetical protein